jgi:hypothetical protein
MKTTEKNKYSAPQLKVVSFKIEHGFTGSFYQSVTLFAPVEGEEIEEMEVHDLRQGWGSGNANSFF